MIRRALSTLHPSHPALRNNVRQLGRLVRRAAVLALGGTVLLAGIAMIVLPGPAIVAIPAGLSILATEFAWAARLKENTWRRAQGWLGERAPGLGRAA